MAKRIRYDIEQRAGTTLRRGVVLVGPNKKSIQLEGCTALMDLRTSIDAEEPSLTLSTENGGIELDTETDEADVLRIYISAEDMSALGGSASISYRYDIEITWPGGDVTSPLYGKIKVTPEVTRSDEA